MDPESRHLKVHEFNRSRKALEFMDCDIWDRYSSRQKDPHSPGRIRKCAGARQTSGDADFQWQNIPDGNCISWRRGHSSGLEVDEAGNCVFRQALDTLFSHVGLLTTMAFEAIMGKATRVTIVEADNIVPAGSIDPNYVDLPAIFVDRIVPSTAEKVIDIRKL
ncbi:hypothetical protein OIDMADRAFT_53034 [Oidiodendron maius Zn]|uniref:Uncharacterized protein n=1 Tax=Oidiodendron maius (strain Zn) TaxID=913774 RepID=A0A0C3DMK3_OIDMZ|nr:hypothetical protein OIDMADRAFT_53034 [Oidiodendron maius Zn]